MLETPDHYSLGAMSEVLMNSIKTTLNTACSTVSDRVCRNL